MTNVVNPGAKPQSSVGMDDQKTGAYHDLLAANAIGEWSIYKGTEGNRQHKQGDGESRGGRLI